MHTAPKQHLTSMSKRLLVFATVFDLCSAHQSITANDTGERIQITASEHDAFSSFNSGEGP